jgi:hypothetical protein
MPWRRRLKLKPLVLFDIDGTIARMEEGLALDKPTPQMKDRPLLDGRVPFVFEQLTTLGYRVGLFTARADQVEEWVHRNFPTGRQRYTFDLIASSVASSNKLATASLLQPFLYFDDHPELIKQWTHPNREFVGVRFQWVGPNQDRALDIIEWTLQQEIPEYQPTLWYTNPSHGVARYDR